MPTNKHTAIDPAGVVHTRNSPSGRIYTHCVVARDSFEKRMKRALAPRKYEAENFNYCKNNGKTSLMQGCNSAEEYVALHQADRVASVNAKPVADWENLGWCVSHQLAVKKLHGSNYESGGYFSEAVILEVEMTHSTPKKAKVEV